MAKAVALELVVGDLGHRLGCQRVPRLIASAVPAVGLAGSAYALVVPFPFTSGPRMQGVARHGEVGHVRGDLATP